MKTYASVVVFSAALLLAGLMGPQDQAADAARYCEMVGLWQQDADAGIPENERIGWPPYKGTAGCAG